MNILVTGGDGQLASCLKSCINKDNEHTWYFFNRKELDITDIDNIDDVINYYDIELIVNCAAYTNVDMAELESIKAHSINAQGPRNLAQCAKQYGAKLIHISTDFVFDGNKNSPYLISDKTEPKSEYGLSKALGEKFLYRYDNAITIRVSWLYSEYCKNFFKTMYQRIKNHEKTYVVNDQIGTPTYARDLANFIIYLIENNKLEETKNKVYHFSNEGCCSWYDFAKAIEIEFNRLDGGESLEHQVINPISTYGYQTMIGKPMAIRPSYSILSHMGIEQIYDKPIRHWLEALNECYIRNRNIE